MWEKPSRPMAKKEEWVNIADLAPEKALEVLREDAADARKKKEREEYYQQANNNYIDKERIRKKME